MGLYKRGLPALRAARTRGAVTPITDGNCVWAQFVNFQIIDKFDDMAPALMLKRLSMRINKSHDAFTATDYSPPRTSYTCENIQ